MCCAEGKSLAKTYGSKYMEVSAILNHRVDELLVSSLKQIRLCVGRRATAADRRPTSGDALRPTDYDDDDDDRPATDATTTTSRSRPPGLLSRLIRAASPRRT